MDFRLFCWCSWARTFFEACGGRVNPYRAGRNQSFYQVNFIREDEGVIFYG
jgi:hypothetical protein